MGLIAFDDRDAWAAATGCPLTLIAFEGIPHGTQITTDLQPFGIELVSGDSVHQPGPTTQFVTSSASLPFSVFNPGTLPSEPNFLSNRLTPGVFATGTLRLDFRAPTSAVGAFIADRSPLDDFQIEVFDDNGSLGVITVGPRSLPSSFVGVVSDVPFIAARFSAVSPDDSWGLDNLEFCRLATCLTLDFETEDDLVTPLGNGQSLTTPPEFGLLVSVSSAGANLGPTTFDSDPSGPNSGTADPDMLIDKGNILMLQDSAQPASSGDSWVTPIDDPDGGDLIFDFTRPSEPESVVLIDLDPAPNLGAAVTLTDSASLTRVYAVPAGWTGTFGGAPGWKTLDLATLADQAGNAPGYKLATASEMAGFDPFAVERVVVHMTGRGAIDDLSVCSPNLLRASALPRNGSGVNHVTLANAAQPVIGRTWAADLDCTGLGNGLAIMLVRSQPASGRMTAFGEILVAGALLHRTFQPCSNGTGRLTWDIPLNLSLLGLHVHAQGFCQGTMVQGGSRTLAVCGALSNAIDLTLGF